MSLVSVMERKHIVSVRMNRPDVRNAFNPEMIEELTRIFRGFEKRKDLRAVIFSGEGKIFCAGADLSWMKAMVNYSLEQNREDSMKLFSMFEAMALCPLPVLGLAHGAAYGGALGLLACCDEVIVEKGTSFCFSEVKLGIAPAVISSFVLRKTSAGLVRPLMLSGRVFDAEEARRTGLVHHIVEAGGGLNEIEKLALQWCEAGPEAVRETKRLLNDNPNLDWDQQRERTARLIAERRVSTEGQEGLKSFLEKRNPSWRDL
ncbi:MAG: enoyl-CoA hydratase/isomerase family protein [Bdellovibrionaceae bacterium]|nr:enoyl-CoA hydratase/isomerase family protein [Pseudobdellovibrionaceae bacterium]MBX3032622.1 enoyl-CoA hydratase/isomerase family protein [Pseudobdellovibrionaceae bacterium]